MTEKPEFPDELEDDDEDQSVDVPMSDEDDDDTKTAPVAAPSAAPAAAVAPIEEPFRIEDDTPAAADSGAASGPSSSDEAEPAAGERPFAPAADDEPTPHLIALGSGRGGAGK